MTPPANTSYRRGTSLSWRPGPIFPATPSARNFGTIS